MNVKQLIETLQQYPPDARIIVAEEMGTSELDEEHISLDVMQFVEFPSGHYPPMWQYPSEYKRKILKTEKVVIINA